MLAALINGIIRLDYYGDSTITEELLKNELYPEESSDNFAALLHKIRALIKSMASSDMDQTQAETFLVSQTKKRDGAITDSQAKVLLQIWKSHRVRVHDSLVRSCVWNNRLSNINWRIDVKSRSRNVEQLNAATAVVELELENSDANSQGVEVVKFEVDEKGLGNVLQSLKDIEQQIDTHSGLTTS